MPRPAPLPHGFALAPFTTRYALDRGVPPHRLRAADLTSPFRGIRSLDPPEALDAWCQALLRRLGPDHVFSHATAAALWGLPLPSSAPLPLHVSALAGREPRALGVIGHRIHADRVERRRLRGLPVVSAADAWCQLGGALGHRDLVAAGDRMLGWPRPLVAVEAIEAAMRRHAGGRGMDAVRRAHRDLRTGSASRRESLLRLDVLAAGFPEPERNGRIDLADDDVRFGDLVWRAERVILEYDGDHHRSDPRRFARDVERLNALAAAGWTVIRVRDGVPTASALRTLAQVVATR